MTLFLGIFFVGFSSSLGTYCRSGSGGDVRVGKTEPGILYEIHCGVAFRVYIRAKDSVLALFFFLFLLSCFRYRGGSILYRWIYINSLPHVATNKAQQLQKKKKRKAEGSNVYSSAIFVQLTSLPLSVVCAIMPSMLVSLSFLADLQATNW